MRRGGYRRCLAIPQDLLLAAAEVAPTDDGQAEGVKQSPGSALSCVYLRATCACCLEAGHTSGEVCTGHQLEGSLSFTQLLNMDLDLLEEEEEEAPALPAAPGTASGTGRAVFQALLACQLPPGPAPGEGSLLLPPLPWRCRDTARSA